MLPARPWLNREWPVVLALAVLALTRLLWLDADPNQFKRPGDISDEGVWWRAARGHALTGEWDVEGIGRWGLWAGPLYTLVARAAFAVGGVNFYAGRLPSALAGIALGALVYAVTRRDYGQRLALVVLLMLGLNVHVYSYNRLGLIESLRLLLVFCALWLWARPGRRPRFSALGSSALIVAAALCKLQPDVFFFPPALWALDWLRGSLRRDRLVVFAVPVALAALAFAGYLALNPALLSAFIAQVPWLIELALASRAPANLPFLPYAVLANPLLTSLPVYLLALLALPALADNLAGLIASPRQWAGRLKAVDQIAWAILLACLLIGVTYDLGDRRMFPLALPLAVLAAQGLASGWRLAGLRSRLEWGGRPAALALAFVGLLWLSWGKDALANPWPDFTLGWWAYWAGAAGAAGAALAGLYFLYRRPGRGDARLLLAALALTYLLILTDLTALDFNQRVLRADAPRWATMLLAAGVAAVCLVAFSRAGPLWGAALPAAYLAFGVWAIGAQLVRPSFTMRDASRQVNEFAGPGGLVATDMTDDICTEVRVSCRRFGSLRLEAMERLRLALAETGYRLLWLSRYHRESVGGAAEAPCLYDPAGQPVAGLTWLADFEVHRGAGQVRLILYEMHDPVEWGCQARAATGE